MRQFKLSNDPDFVAKLRDVVGLYVDPPAHAIVLSVDEKSQIQALDRTQPGLPMKRGRLGTMTHDYKRHGTTTLFAALNVLEGKVIGRCMQRHRHQEFIRFLNAIEADIPAGEGVHVILDNYAAHKHAKVRAWLGRHERFTFHFVPTSCSWLNAVEGFFAKLSKRRLKRGVFRSIVDLQVAINRFLDETNDNPKPFTWTADPDKIIAAVKPASSVRFDPLEFSMWECREMAKQQIDPRILALCEKVTAKRPRVVIDHILEHGYITTEELQIQYGYDHPPRAARDVRENGIPLETFKMRSERTERIIGAYRFADPNKIRRGRIGGRRAFSKVFRDALIARFDSRDGITGEHMEARYLQIDHRVPYEVAGENAYEEDNYEEYMLLDASSQRAKSWSCEHCYNWQEGQEVAVCRSCFWAYPESYTHVAGEEVRRVYVEWRGAEVEVFEELRVRAEREGISVGALMKRLSKG